MHYIPQAFMAVYSYPCLHSWMMTLCCHRLVCQHFREAGCFHLQGEVTKQWPNADIYSSGP